MAGLSSELRAWVVPGLAGTIASVDGDLQPQIARVWAARPGHEPDVIEVYVLRAACDRLLAAVATSGRAALNLTEVSSYQSRMFKGTCALSQAEVAPAFLEQSLEALSRAIHGVGMPHDTVEQLLSHSDAPRDMLPLCLTVESVFDQSPKRGAGARL